MLFHYSDREIGRILEDEHEQEHEHDFSTSAFRFNRTGQALGPGKDPSKSALKGRPMRTDENEYLAIHLERSSHSAALSGRIPSGKNPGLEGLGYGL